MEVSVIIPAYNEEENIGSVLTTLPPEYEKIVVDDGSTDKTREKAGEFNGVTVISHKKKQGKGAALKTGLKNSTGDILVFIDGDGQFNSSEIHALTELIQENKADLVLGFRDFSKIPPKRRITNKLARLAVCLITNKKLKDPLIGFRAVSRKCIQQIKLEEDDFRTDTEMLIKLNKKSCRIGETPITINYRSNKSHFSTIDGIKLSHFLLKTLLSNLLGR